MGSRKISTDSDFLESALSKELWWSRLVFWGAAAFLGLIAVGFAEACQWAGRQFMAIYSYSPYLPFFICPVGFLLIVQVQRRFFGGAEGSGIPQVVATLRTRSQGFRDSLLSLRVLFGKLIGTFLGLLCGASIGREGPSVHIGAALFNFLGHYARFTKFERRQGLVIAGAAAGLAAAFNAPLAGIVFAIEELKGSFEQRTSGLMLSAVILSGLTALSLLGHYQHFGSVDASIGGFDAALAVLGIGFVGGALGGFFGRLILTLGPLLKRWRPKRAFLVPLLLGFFVATMGYFSDGSTFGSGYQQANALIHESNGEMSFFFPILKFLASLFSYVTGIAGGIFAPALSVGAGLGFWFVPLFSDFPVEALVIVGMVSYLAGVIRAPVTAFVIVFEMVADHFLLIPLMAASFLAVGVSKLVCPTPLYKGLADAYISVRDPA